MAGDEGKGEHRQGREGGTGKAYRGRKNAGRGRLQDWLDRGYMWAGGGRSTLARFLRKGEKRLKVKGLAGEE